MMRTSLYLSPLLRARLQIASGQERKSISALIGELLDQALAARERTRLKRLYEGFDRLDGIGPTGVTDASTTVDHVLYGERGTWSGRLERP